MTRLSGAWLNAAATRAIFACLTDGGYQAYAVGGAIRNELLGFPVADVDFATDARPEKVMELAAAASLIAIPTGKEHGTITLLARGVAHEVTTFRKDIDTDGRHATVRFARTLVEDAHRRDFTINALYCDASGRLCDPLGGLADIRMRRVRFIDDAAARIAEDYLRILRFFRFQAWFGDAENGMDPEALAAIADKTEGLERLSKERVGAEMRKLLGAPDPAPSVATMQTVGVLARILPGARADALGPLVHLEGLNRIPPQWCRRLAVLGGENQVDLLRLSRVERRALALLVNQIATNTTLEELAYRHGADSAVSIILLRAALTGGPVPDHLLQKATRAAAQKFPVRAADITSGETGAALGARLAVLEKRWIDSDFGLDREALLGR